MNQLYPLPLINEGEIPQIWTPEHVMVRMIHAFSTLRLIPDHVGPKQPNSAWVPILHELNAMGYDEKIAIINDRREVFQNEKEKARAHDVSLMDEALSWCLVYLADKPLHADALNLYGHSKAHGRPVDPLLRKRYKEALYEADKNNAELESAKQMHAKQAAQECAVWANRKIKLAGNDAQRINNIKENAHIRFERIVLSYCANKKRITAQQASPSRVVTRERYVHYRKQAAQIVCKQLIKNRVPVR
jgi:hypothetical protein